MSTKRPDQIAKQMFFVGLALLPWLWIVNILYFWDEVYGRLPCMGEKNDDMRTNEQQETINILGMAESSDQDNDNVNDSLPPDDIHAELCKWVKRSTVGALIAIVGISAWAISFQLNKDHFSSRWFVMSQDDAEVTGW